MDSAIYFDRELRGVAIKIDDISRDHLLTAEVKPIRRIPPQSLPQPLLRERHFATELFREQELLWLDRLTAYDFAASIHEKIGT